MIGRTLLEEQRLLTRVVWAQLMLSGASAWEWRSPTELFNRGLETMGAEPAPDRTRINDALALAVEHGWLDEDATMPLRRKFRLTTAGETFMDQAFAYDQARAGLIAMLGAA